MNNICNYCGQKIQTAHKEEFNAMKLKLLKRAASHVMNTMNNDFKVKEFAQPEEFKQFHNFQKLRYHGLITPVTDKITGQRIKGRWLITRNGWAFLRGEFMIPKYVLVKNNKITSHSDKLISIKDVYYGSDSIQTTFEYFDENNRAVGYRPTVTVLSEKQLILW
jgi:hypothetical protein